MPLKNTQTQYGVVAKTFHWGIALLIIGMLVAGLTMGGIEKFSLQMQIYGLHKSTGILILMLAGLRLSWKLITPPPEMLKEKMKDWEINLAKAVHAALYICLFLMPLTGWLMSSAKGFSVSFFGLFTLPDLISNGKRAATLYAQVHELLAYALILIISLHVIGALKHHFINKDRTLRRMLPFGAYALLITSIFTAPALANQPPSFTPNWEVLKDQSHIKFISKQMGAEFEGEFEDFNATIYFDVSDLPASKVEVSIPISSTNTRSEDRDEKIRSEAWFNIEEHPRAFFYSDKITKAETGDNSYIAHGTLKIKGTEQPFNLPFTLDISDDLATMQSNVEMQRLNWNLGTGDWADTSFVANEVKLDIKVTANARPPTE